VEYIFANVLLLNIFFNLLYSGTCRIDVNRTVEYIFVPVRLLDSLQYLWDLRRCKWNCGVYFSPVRLQNILRYCIPVGPKEYTVCKWNCEVYFCRCSLAKHFAIMPTCGTKRIDVNGTVEYIFAPVRLLNILQYTCGTYRIDVRVNGTVEYTIFLPLLAY
jgi:hypothetical protein